MTYDEIQKLKFLSSDVLLSRTNELVTAERQTTTAILYYFVEIERRRLHLERGFSSLHEFAVKHLHYSDGAAHRRIAASRLLKELPQIEQRIETGSLNLSVAAQAQDFFISEKRTRQKTYSHEEKSAILNKLEDKSLREAQKELLRISPEAIPKERERQLTEDKTEIKIVIGEPTRLKLGRLKELLSHARPAITTSELIDQLADIALEKLEKVKLPEPEMVSQSKNKARNRSRSNAGVQAPAGRGASAQKLESASRYIPASVRRAVWAKDKGTCCYKDSRSGRICGSRYRLEIDHIQPYSLGGEATVENLRLLCKSHNSLVAIQKLGRDKMGQYLKA